MFQIDGWNVVSARLFRCGLLCGPPALGLVSRGPQTVVGDLSGGRLAPLPVWWGHPEMSINAGTL